MSNRQPAPPLPALLLQALIAVLLSACPGLPLPAVGHPPADLDNAAFAQELIDAHDEIRASVSPPPSSALPSLAWDDDAAALAQQWANGCVFEHRQPNDLGENLAVFSDPAVQGAAVVALWGSESVDYDYDANECAAGRQCGHYTQIVWESTTRLGCGVALCNDVTGFGSGALWVCNYDPPGNFVGQRTY